MRRICRFVLACAVLVSATAQAKKLDVAVSRAPLAIGTSVDKANSVVSADRARLLRLFRELHDETQAGRVEARVAGAIASALVERGFEVAFGADGTEVIATLRNGPGPTLIYRTDTGADLLPSPVRRAGTREPSSGVATTSQHRCGHDAGVTWMLGMAKALVALRDEWSGTLVLVSQPTRLLGGAEPTAPGSHPLRMPKADMVVALGAAPSPLGSILSVRGQRRAGSGAAELVMSRIGVYQAPHNLDKVTQLAASTTRLYGLPDDALVGYLLIGIANRDLATDLAGDLEGAEARDADAGAIDVDLAAISLGTKLATVAVLELLKKHGAARPEPPRHTLQWTLHDY